MTNNRLDERRLDGMSDRMQRAEEALALEYPAPERDKHQVSDFVKSRGRTARTQENERDHDPPKKRPPNDRRGGSRGDRQRGKPKPDRIEKDEQKVKRLKIRPI